MGKISLGSVDIKKIALAAVDLKKISLGAVQIWAGITNGAYLLTSNFIPVNSATTRNVIPVSVNSGVGYESFPVSGSGAIRLPAGSYVLNMGWNSVGFRTDWKAGGVSMPSGEAVTVPNPNVGSAGAMTFSVPFTMTAEGDVSIITSVASASASNRTISTASFSATIALA